MSVLIMPEKPMDSYLASYAGKYDRWQTEGDFTFSSRVIPVRESFTARQWVLPGEQVLSILGEARSFALTDCVCRTHYHRCDRPRDVCLLLDDMSDRAVAKKRARRLSLDEAAEVLERAEASGLVHLALYMPGRKVYALCSCCACCCHDLRLLLDHGRRDLVARSDYEAVTDPDRCTGCGKCIEACIINARAPGEPVVTYDDNACLGCGLCVPACPEGAIVMNLRKETS